MAVSWFSCITDEACISLVLRISLQIDKIDNKYCEHFVPKSYS